MTEILVWLKEFEIFTDDYVYTNNLSVNEIIIDDDENIFLIGYFTDSVDFDPGISVEIRATTGTEGLNDIFILKLNNLGEFIWVTTFGGDDRDFGIDIEIDATNNLYAVGSFRGIADFDPSDDEFLMSTADVTLATFVEKLSSDGDFIWAKKIAGTAHTRLSKIEISPINTIYISGEYAQTVDLDPGPDEYLLYSADIDGEISFDIY